MMRALGTFRCVGLAAACLLALALPARAAAPANPVQTAYDQAKAQMMSNPDEARRLAEAGEKAAAALPESRERTLGIAAGHWLRAEALLRTDRAAEARPLLVDALKMVETAGSTSKLRGDLLQSFGLLQMQDGKAAEALDSYQKAYKIFQALGEARSQSIALQNIAWLYSTANDNVQAAKYYRQAAEAYSGDPALSLSLHNNRGIVLVQLERHDEADAEYRLAFALAERLGQPMLKARILSNMARNLVEGDKLAEAERILPNGFALARGEEGLSIRQQLLATSARIAFLRGDLNRAVERIGQSFAGVDLTTTTSAQRDAHFMAYSIYAATGDKARALAHLEALRRINDESVKVATSTNAALMAARFDYANQELRIANLRAEELRKSVAYERQRSQLQRIIFFGAGGATLIVIVLLSVSLFAIHRSRNQVRAANRDLARTNAALEKALAAKTEFLATTSHEIRTPLNGILGMTQVMLADKKLGAATRDRINIVHAAGVTMRALVDDILDVAKMETGNMTVDAVPTDLCATLREVTRLWEEQARSKGLAFTLDVEKAPGWILSDPGRLRQIVFNLLSNAIKFTEAGGVTLRAMAEGEGEAARLRIAVSDTGVGIPSAKQHEVFESFKQADTSTTRRFGGTGLGLTICRNLAQALGGDILVESAEGSGSTFTLDLPLVPAEAPANAPEAGVNGAMLILDRNPIARGMLRTLFEPYAGAPRFFGTPDEAIEALGAGPVALLLIDEATLKASGDDVAENLTRLATTAATSGASTALLWTNPDDAWRETVAATGINQLIAKPVTGTALISALFPAQCGKSGTDGAGPLVSRAA